MDKLTLYRDVRDPDGLFGHIEHKGLQFWTVELPWRDNQTNISCIPPGTYLAKIRKTHTNDAVGLDVAYELQDVEGRANIQIHVANYPRDVRGCIGLGMARAHVGGRYMVTRSRDAIKSFYALMEGAPFLLEVVEVK